MGITAIIGQQGRGKSFYMCWLALNHAMRFCKRLVTNFPLNIEFLEKFAIANNLRNLHKMISAGDIIFIPGDVEYLLSIPDSCVLFDEAAIFLGDATQSHKVSYLISRFNQCRKRGIELFYTGQAFTRVPKILRDITTSVIFCNGICTRDEWGKPLLYHAKFTYFDPDEFDTWFSSSKRGNFVYTFNKSYKRHNFILSSYFALFFNVYDSFIDVVADAPAPGYKRIKIIPRGKTCILKEGELLKFPLSKLTKTSKIKFHPIFIKIFKYLLNKKSYKTNDYIHPLKWDNMIAQRPLFEFSDPFKLNWLEKRVPVVVYKSGSAYEYPKFIRAGFVISWRLSYLLPAPLQPLLELFKSLTFPVPSDSKFIKFKQFKF
jgi:hypothetical protein